MNGLRKLLKISFVVVLITAALMIAAPRVWVKNKRAHFVQNGKVRTGPQLYFGSGDRLLVLPEHGEVAYVSAPVGGPGDVKVCEKGQLRYFKMLAFADASRCRLMMVGNTRRGEFSWTFTAVDGSHYEVSWETDFRR